MMPAARPPSKKPFKRPWTKAARRPTPTSSARSRAATTAPGSPARTSGTRRPQYIEAARTCLGAIDLDPASAPVAQKTIRAARFFTRDDDGLRHEWRGRIWLNPPYSQPDIARFIDKLLAEIDAGRATAGHSAHPQLHRHRLVPCRRRAVRRHLLHPRPDPLRRRLRRDRRTDARPGVLLLRHRPPTGSARRSTPSGSSDDGGQRIQPAALGLRAAAGASI